MTLEEKRKRAQDLCDSQVVCTDCPCRGLACCVVIEEASEEELDSILEAFDYQEGYTASATIIDDLIGPGERTEVPANPEMVDHPAHYQGRHECIEVMRAMFGDEAVKSFCRCNSFKYRFRADKKNGEEDIRKAEFYEDYLMKMEGRI